MKNNKLKKFVFLAFAAIALFGCQTIDAKSSYISQNSSISNPSSSSESSSSDSSSSEAPSSSDSSGNEDSSSSSIESSSETPSSSSVEPSSSSSSSSSTPSSSKSTYSSEVGKYAVEEIVLAQDSYRVAYHKSLTLKATVKPSNATNKTVKWTSSDPDTISVTNTGYVYAWEIGEADLTCSSTDGTDVSTTVHVESYGIAVTSLVAKETKKNAYVGDTFKIEIKVYPDNASFKDVSIDFSVPGVATADQESGLITCKKAGTTNIIFRSVSNPDIVTTCSLSVAAVDVKDFYFNKQFVTLHVNDTYETKATFIPSIASNRDLAFVSSNPSIATIDEDGIITAHSVGETTITGTLTELGIKNSFKVDVLNEDQPLRTYLNYTYKDYFKNDYLGRDNAPSHSPKFLVVPIWFTDSNQFINTQGRQNVLNDLNAAFFGSNSETGWRSVKSYYEEESYGGCELGGMVTDWYEIGSSYKTYATDSNYTINAVSNAYRWFQTRYPEIPLTDFDGDRNGYIDAIIVIYGAPDYGSSYSYNSENLWAYCTWMGGRANIEKPTTNALMWASYDFMYNSNTANTRAGSRYGGGDTSHCKIDAHTYIHESGHLLGLDDYYDYAGKCSPAGGFSMQDENVGGHDPFSIMSLGWTDPYIPTESSTFIIKPFVENGDVILLTPEWNDDNSPFDEYILVELFVNSGANKFDCDFALRNRYQGPSRPGIRIWHVDARLAITNGYTVNPNNWTTNPSTPDGKVTEMFSNSYSADRTPLGSKYINYNQLQLIRKNTSVGLTPTDYLNNDTMFHTGDIFTMDKYYKQFVNKEDLNKGIPLNWEINMLNVTSTEATIRLTKLDLY
ncbi:MAG: Ig-like domain-containing protein [Bacilli bacterium]|nr:Ig-like domain-containing protein [Bacilli bacterium]